MVTDVEMLRAGIRRDLAGPLGVSVLCGLDDPTRLDRWLPRSDSPARPPGSGAAAAKVGDGAVVAIGNAPTALDEALRSSRHRAGGPPASSGSRSGSWRSRRRSAGSMAQDLVPYRDEPRPQRGDRRDGGGGQRLARAGRAGRAP